MSVKISMLERKRTQVIVLGEGTISGSKIVRRRLSEPKLEVNFYDRNLVIYPAPDVKKIIFRILIRYKEATTKQDIPNFLFSLKRDGKIIKEILVSDPDLYSKYEEFFSLLDIEIDLEKYDYKNLEFDAHLEAWLDLRKWKAEAYAKYETLSAEADTSIKIDFDAPELNLEIFPTHSPGKDLKNHINTDWGNPFFLNLHLNNKTNKTVEPPGNFSLFENYNYLKDATLKGNLPPKLKTIIISEGNVTWILEKGPKDFAWYRANKNGEFEIIKTNQIYGYYATGDLHSKNINWKNLESNHLLVNVRVPDYKLKAMKVYNDVKNVKAVSDLLNISNDLAELGKLLSVAGLATIASKVSKWASAFAIILTLEIEFGTAWISNEAQQILSTMKQVMDDPPQLAADYKRSKSVLHHTEKSFRGIINIIELCGLSNNKYWTAKLKGNQKYALLHLKDLRRNKRILNSEIKLVTSYVTKLTKKLGKVKTVKPSKKNIGELRKLSLSSKQVSVMRRINKKVSEHKGKLLVALKNMNKSLKLFGEAYGNST